MVQMYERIKKELYLNTKITYILRIYNCFKIYIFQVCFTSSFHLLLLRLVAYRAPQVSI